MNGQQIVDTAIDRVNAEPGGPGLSKDAATILLGDDAALDSLAFVSLIVGVEEIIAESLGHRVTLADEMSFETDGNPFATVGALTAHVDHLLEG